MIQLNKVLKTFTRTLDQLEQLVSRNTQEVGNNDLRIEQLQGMNGVLLDEASQARYTADKIREMLGK